MIIARRHVRRVHDQRRAVVRFHDAQRAHRVQPLGEAASELGRHVLHHEHGRATPRGEPRHHVRERARATGGRGERDDAARPRAQRGVPAARRHRRPGEHRDARHVGGEGALHGGDELRAHAQHRRPVRLLRLGHDLHGAELQRPDRGAGPRAGVGAHDDDGPRRFRHDVADRAEAVELGHLEVHRHHVGLELVHLAHGVEPVPCRRDHVEPAQHVAQHAPHQGAVVHHEDARGGAAALR